MGWTPAQQKVIDTRNKNILVSAAAGSGKTAVLVERIITMISEGEAPLDIDHLLVVTFTNAAAAEMRTRIGKAIDEKLLKNPENLHLQKQISLLQSAQITTIHSFCLNVIRNYFHRIDLDPSFKIADESEITLMKSDVLEEILERWYENGREDFHAFIESYSHSKSDAPVEDLILLLYNFSMSAPWPKAWLADKQKAFEINTLEDMNISDWMKELLHYVCVVLGDLLDKNSDAMNICNESGGPGAYLTALISDRDLIEQLMRVDSYEEYSVLFSGISYARLSGKKEEGVSQFKKDRVKSLREEVKKGLKDLANQYFFQSPEEMLKDLKAVREVMQVMFELTMDFMEEFARRKEEKNLIDFNDLEHFALKILVEDKDGEKVPTQAALELSELFDEILIDEYQDSNMVQETILSSISKERIGKPNRFMVGDVKQSIYKFRLAMPEIFMEKYGRYGRSDFTEDGEINLEQRIDLDRNFRSRKVVLDGVNAIFEQIMKEAVGGIRYDDAAALKYGGLYEEEGTEQSKDITELSGNENSEMLPNWSAINPNLNRISQDMELLLVTEDEVETISFHDSVDKEHGVSKDEKENLDLFSEAYDGSMNGSTEHRKTEEDPEEAVYTKKEIEVRAIARRIKELTDPITGLMLYDSKQKIYRPAAYRDIVILLRSMSNWSEVFVNTLIQEGIPAYADTGTGYFRTMEIMTILNYLRIIDNPRQDIPLTGVLYSPIVGLSSTELAMIRVSNRNASMYSAFNTYLSEGSNEELKQKLLGFNKQLGEFRAKMIHTPLHELLQEILDQTGYYYYVSAMTGGDRRKANIDMLLSMAVRFEKGSYSGLFNFIRYIEKLHKYDVDFGEAATTGEQDNTVRIMSIHKSKGLEFPVVFVSGMHKQFNNQDLRNSVVLHAGLGVGPEYVNCKERTKVPTLLKKVIQKKVQLENLGEELRVLYVAMTRAKEKLIMTGYLEALEDLKNKEFSFFELASAKSYLDWVLPAVINRTGMNPVMTEDGCCIKKDLMSVTIVRKDSLLKEELRKQMFQQIEEEELLAITQDQVYDPELNLEIKSRLNYYYPYQKEAGLRVKMTVTELKKLGQFVDEEQSVNLYQGNGNDQEADNNLYETKLSEVRTSQNINIANGNREVSEFNPTVPNFIKQKEAELTGTDRGTLYHKILELLDLTKIKNRDDFLGEMDRIVQEGRVTTSDIQKLKQDYIYKFTQSTVAARMCKAQLAGMLYKEKQFVIGINAVEVITEINTDEIILIQGIIDVFFEEDGELVLLDYKSDIVGDEEQLVKRYKVQLDYYRRALEQMLKKRVKEMIIYSLYLGKEIRIE
ncbi:MAG: hypothetical protein K0S76_813 [Herbinix sp.]|nr:hypothetical protein [Herbinix sp.]